MTLLCEENIVNVLDGNGVKCDSAKSHCDDNIGIKLGTTSKHELSEIGVGGVSCIYSSILMCSGLIGVEEPSCIWFGRVDGSTFEDLDILLLGQMNFVRPERGDLA